MMKSHAILSLLLWLNINQYALSVPVSLTGVVKQIHKGVDDVIKGAVKGATEVIGTPVDVKDVSFYLLTSQDGGETNNIVNPYSPKSIAQTESRIFFFIHGWTQNKTSCPWYKPLSEVLLKNDPQAHIVQVDWGKPAGDNYASAAFSTESVGQIISNVIQKLVKENNVPLKKIVVIGHSLGGQIAGWVGKEYRKLTNESLPRIIALDPAGPVFDVRPDSRRLNKHDADVVMVVHSDGLKFGYAKKCGSIDFFPNGGIEQPGCLKLNLTDLSLSTLTDPLWCSHRRAHNVFIEAVKNPQAFVGTKCDSYSNYKSQKCDGNQKVSMGDWQTTKTGSFYLETTGEAPFFENVNSTQKPVTSKPSQGK